jgi:ribonuclease HII
LEYIAGLDEVGRGCGAGPVVTAAVILPKGFTSPLLRDSKKLTEKQRNEAYQLIMENAISVVCHAGSVNDVNELGINPTTFKTMRKCLDDLTIRPQHILVDGIVWEEYDNTPVSKVPKGDDTYLSIAAAAIIAKVRRDEYMVKLHELFPIYEWNSNKGYLSSKHITAIKEKGVCKYHRNQYVRNFI